MAELNLSTDKSTIIRDLLKSPLATIIASVLSTFIISAIFFKLAGPVPISISQTSVQKTEDFNVTGTAQTGVAPDEASISLGIVTEGNNVSSTQNQANSVINNIVKELKSLGIDEKDIKTTNYSVNPRYNFESGGRNITGYTVNASLGVKITDFEILNQAIDAATKLGANQVGGINFSVSETAKNKVLDELRTEAVNQAKEKAQSLAKAAGVKLGKIINIQESSLDEPRPVYRTAELSLEDSAGAPTQIEPGSSEINLSVTLSYEIL